MRTQLGIYVEIKPKVSRLVLIQMQYDCFSGGREGRFGQYDNDDNRGGPSKTRAKMAQTMAYLEN